MQGEYTEADVRHCEEVNQLRAQINRLTRVLPMPTEDLRALVVEMREFRKANGQHVATALDWADRIEDALDRIIV